MSSSTDVETYTQKASLDFQASVLVAEDLIGRSELLQRELRPRLLRVLSAEAFPGESPRDLDRYGSAKADWGGHGIYPGLPRSSEPLSMLHTAIEDTLETLQIKIPGYARVWPAGPLDTRNQLDLLTAGDGVMAVSVRTSGDNDFVERFPSRSSLCQTSWPRQRWTPWERAGGVASLVRSTEGQSLLIMAEGLKNRSKPADTPDDAWERFSTTVGHFHHHMSAFDKIPTEELVVACLLDSVGLVGPLASYFDEPGIRRDR